MSIMRVCQISNEAEAKLVCAILDEEKVPYTLIRMEDMAFDGLYASQTEWGHIEAPSDYADSILQIVSDVRSAHPEDTLSQGPTPQRPKKRSRTVEIGIGAALLIACTFLLITVINLKHENDRLGKGPLVTWKWNPPGRYLEGRMNSTGQIRYRDYDRNLNRIYEEIDAVTKDGKYTVISYFRHEDGYADEVVVRDSNGVKIDDEFDSRGLGYFDTDQVYYGPDAHIEYLSTTGELPFDKVIIHSNGKTKTIDIRKDLLGIPRTASR